MGPWDPWDQSKERKSQVPDAHVLSFASLAQVLGKDKGSWEVKPGAHTGLWILGKNQSDTDGAGKPRLQICSHDKAFSGMIRIREFHRRLTSDLPQKTNTSFGALGVNSAVEVFTGVEYHPGTCEISLGICNTNHTITVTRGGGRCRPDERPPVFLQAQGPPGWATHRLSPVFRQLPG